MAESNSTSITLKKAEEERLQDIFHFYWGKDPHLKLNNFINLLLDKNIVTNGTALHEFASVFNESGQGREYLDCQKFFYSLSMLGRKIYSNEKSPVDQMFTKVLVDPNLETTEDTASILKEKVYTPRFDEEMCQLLKMPCMELYETFNNGLQVTFASYVYENVVAKRKVVSWRDIREQNLAIRARDYLRFCRKQKIIPHLINVENLQECMMAARPPRSYQERMFYEQSCLTEAYEQERNYESMPALSYIEGEPMIQFHEFTLILGVIAAGYVPKVQGIPEKVRIIFQNKLKLEPEVDGIGTLGGPNLWAVSEELKDPKILLEEHKKLKMVTDNRSLDLTDVVTSIPLVPTVDEIMSEFDKDSIPQLPPEVKIQVQKPAEVEVISFALPKPVDPKEAKAAAAQRTGGGNNTQKKDKDEEPLKFAPIPGQFLHKLPGKAREDLFAEQRQKLRASDFPNNAKQGSVNSGVQPCVIREILLLPESPNNVTALIESAQVYQNSRQYNMAIQTFKEAQDKWNEIEELNDDQELFFALSLAAIYESCGKDELALGQYFVAKTYSDKLKYNSPDKALVYCGIGSVLHHLGRNELAARAFLNAKRIREKWVGPDTVDTATVYNNLGVVFFALGRFKESHAYFELGEAILEEFLGPSHPRTVTAKRNITKSKRSSYMAPPEYKPIWRKQVVDLYSGGKKKKKKKGKKKKKR